MGNALQNRCQFIPWSIMGAIWLSGTTASFTRRCRGLVSPMAIALTKSLVKPITIGLLRPKASRSAGDSGEEARGCRGSRDSAQSQHHRVIFARAEVQGKIDFWRTLAFNPQFQRRQGLRVRPAVNRATVQLTACSMPNKGLRNTNQRRRRAWAVSDRPGDAPGESGWNSVPCKLRDDRRKASDYW